MIWPSAPWPLSMLAITQGIYMLCVIVIVIMLCILASVYDSHHPRSWWYDYMLAILLCYYYHFRNQYNEGLRKICSSSLPWQIFTVLLVMCTHLCKQRPWWRERIQLDTESIDWCKKHLWYYSRRIISETKEHVTNVTLTLRWTPIIHCLLYSPC